MKQQRAKKNHIKVSKTLQFSRGKKKKKKTERIIKESYKITIIISIVIVRELLQEAHRISSLFVHFHCTKRDELGKRKERNSYTIQKGSFMFLSLQPPKRNFFPRRLRRFVRGGIRGKLSKSMSRWRSTLSGNGDSAFLDASRADAFYFQTYIRRGQSRSWPAICS